MPRKFVKVYIGLGYPVDSRRQAESRWVHAQFPMAEDFEMFGWDLVLARLFLLHVRDVVMSGTIMSPYEIQKSIFASDRGAAGL